MAIYHLNFAPQKALAAVQLMLERAGTRSPDLHTVLKTCYFADVEHLNAYGSPVFGASYRAMRYGPVPVQIYEMLKREPYWLPELGQDDYPWRLEGIRVRRSGNEEPAMDHLSSSDREVILNAFEHARSMDFDQRTAATHGPDWQKAQLGWIDYRDMIRDDNPNREEIIEDLEEMGHRLAL